MFSPHFLLEAPIGLLPSVVFLLVLLQLDAYKLVDFREISECLVAGIILAGVSYYTNARAIGILKYSVVTYSHVAAPIAEESLKAAFMIVLFARNRIGFMIDAAITGFAIGTGFALAENVYYLSAVPNAQLGVWIVRGFGTAIMHGGTVAIFGVMGQRLTEREAIVNPVMLIPGLITAIVIHSLYNFLQWSPLIAAAAMIVTVPMVLLVVFGKSAHKVHTWLLSDYTAHEHLLADIKSGDFTHSEAGRFILDAHNRFDPAVIADLFEYLKLHTQLAIRADEIELAREKGEKLAGGHELHQSFQRLHALEKKIGPAAMLALWPHLHFSRRELWELNELEAHVRHA